MIPISSIFTKNLKSSINLSDNTGQAAHSDVGLSSIISWVLVKMPRTLYGPAAEAFWLFNLELSENIKNISLTSL
jgi:hypothetical protein